MSVVTTVGHVLESNHYYYWACWNFCNKAVHNTEGPDSPGKWPLKWIGERELWWILTCQLTWERAIKWFVVGVVVVMVVTVVVVLRADVSKMLVVICRTAEMEKERLLLELDQLWAELSNVIRVIYHLDNSAGARTVDSDRLTSLISRYLSTHFIHYCQLVPLI